MSEQADIETALARATAAYKNVRAERDALKDANDRAEAAEAENDRLREVLELRVADINHLDRKLADILDERDRLREALERITETDSDGLVHTAGGMAAIARAALAKEAGQ